MDTISNPDAFFQYLESSDFVLLQGVFEGFVEFFSAASVVLNRRSKHKKAQHNNNQYKNAARDCSHACAPCELT
ncbi:hypothetical protein WEU41_12705 [Pseudomonas fragi]|uniref:hypothetical protein n=1 Tax=Pseudomonas fragi TaxID=296 RepID=UPI0030B66A99